MGQSKFIEIKEEGKNQFTNLLRDEWKEQTKVESVFKQMQKKNKGDNKLMVFQNYSSQADWSPTDSFFYVINLIPPKLL